MENLGTRTLLGPHTGLWVFLWDFFFFLVCFFLFTGKQKHFQSVGQASFFFFFFQTLETKRGEQLGLILSKPISLK